MKKKKDKANIVLVLNDGDILKVITKSKETLYVYCKGNKLIF